MCAEARIEIFGSFPKLRDNAPTFYSCDISFTNFDCIICIACNVPCTRVLVKLRYVSSFLDTFQPYAQLQTRLKTLCQDVASGRKEVPEFPAGVAHNIRWASIDRETRDGDELA